MHRRVSHDQGASWSEPEDLGFSDQPSCPALLAEGRVVLAWVDRYGSHSIRARVAERVNVPFTPASEVVLWDNS